MFRLGTLITLMLSSAPTNAPLTSSHRSFSASVYSDHYEIHLGHNSVASHTISYISSVEVTSLDYGNRSKRCQYAYSSFVLTRRFTYDILHQSQPYGVRHMQLGTRTWARAFPAPTGDVKGSCSAAFPRIIMPVAAAANTLGIWKDVIDQDDAIVRHSIETGASKQRR